MAAAHEDSDVKEMEDELVECPKCGWEIPLDKPHAICAIEGCGDCAQVTDDGLCESCWLASK